MRLRRRWHLWRIERQLASLARHAAPCASCQARWRTTLTGIEIVHHPECEAVRR